ncbi:DUF5919 domain-containing protein (plasmid) [Mycolicibacterium aichiense]|uniref:DUF5919 domain-containing protein n=1 Tax=Mycolicibacterium aichiense TaxID=1799 RepID=UPI003D664338
MAEVDVFISFKHTSGGAITLDFKLAASLHDLLASRGVSTFFSPVTLAASARSDYSRAIDEALDQARVLVAVGTSRENLEASWVRYEWESFINDQRSGVRADGTLYSLTQGCTPNDLPRALRQYGSFDASELERLVDLIEVVLRTPESPDGDALSPMGQPAATPADDVPEDDVLQRRYAGFLRTPALSDLDDVARAYPSRGSAAEGIGLMALLESADQVDCSGISLNFLCQQMSAPALTRLIRRGCRIRALFLDPDCPAMAARETEEYHPRGKLRSLTQLNVDHLLGVKARTENRGLDGCLDVGLTRETPRFSLTILDGTLCIAQPYMPVLRGVDSPTFVLARRSPAGLVMSFIESFSELWDDASAAHEDLRSR